MINLKDNSIQVKLILLFTAIAVVLSVSIGMLFFHKTKAIVNFSKENELKTLAVETSNKIERFMFERNADIEVMASSPLLRNPTMSKSVKLDYIENVRNAYKTYDYIMITDNEGKIEVLSGELKDDNKYKSFLKYVLSGTMYVSDFNESNSVYFSAPITGSTGWIIGAVIEKMNLNAINEIVGNVHPGKSGYAYLADGEGNTIFNKYRGNVHIDFKGKNPFYLVYNNVELVSAFYPISKYSTERSNWYLIVEESAVEAFQVTTQLRNYTIAVSFVFTFVLLIFGIILSKKVGESFNELLSNLSKRQIIPIF